jgi:hypothetical protein
MLDLVSTLEGGWRLLSESTDDDDDDAIEECDDVRYDHDKAPKGTTLMRRPLELLHEPCRVRSMIVYMVNYAR